MRYFLVLVTSAILVCFTSPIFGAPCSFPVFETGTTHPTGEDPYDVASGDINNDGKIDIVITNHDDSTISVLLGTGTGSFLPTIDSPTPPGPTRLLLANLNGDGMLDVVVLSQSGSNYKVTSLIGNGAGNFSPVHSHSLYNPLSHRIFDMDRDGDDDVVVIAGDYVTISVFIYRNLGTGVFQDPTEYEFPNSSSVALAVGDFNSDGNPDIVHSLSSVLTIWNGDGNGNFTPGWSTNFDGREITPGHFDRDGILDLAVQHAGNRMTLFTGNGSGMLVRRSTLTVGGGSATAADLNLDGVDEFLTYNFASNHVSVMVANGDTTFRPSVNYTTSPETRALATGDFNSDGFPDVVNLSSKIRIDPAIQDHARLTLGRGDGTLVAPINYPIFGNLFPNAVQVADLNHDGRQDIVSANSSGWGLSVLIRIGGFRFAPVRYFLRSKYVNNLAVHDLNGDGHMDIVGVGLDRIFVNTGDGNGSFSLLEEKVVGGFLVSVTVADLNADGIPDLVVGKRDSTRFSVLLGNGNGTFGAETDYLGLGDPVYDIVAADFTSDGRPDLAVVYETGNSIAGRFQMWRNEGNGTFVAGEQHTFGISIHPNAIAVGDINRDGRLDVVVSIDYDPTSLANVRRYLGNGNGTFSYIGSVNVDGWHPNDVVLHDFNDDAILDMATVNDGSEEVSIFEGGSNGSMVVRQRPSAGDQARRMAVGHLNADSAPDIVVANYNDSSLTIMPNSCNHIFESSAQPVFDFDGDGKTDVSIFRPGAGEWWYLRSIDSGNRVLDFGTKTDTIVPADFTGDGRADVAFWSPSSGEWFILRSDDGTYYSFPFGASGDVPVPADYDGDGKADAALFRPSSATWFINRSIDGQTSIVPFGMEGDKAVPTDFDGDGRADLAIFRPNGASGGEWWYLRSSDGNSRAFAFGTATDRTVAGDYTGDGKADIAFFRPSSGEWFVLRSEDSSFYSFPWGTTGDIPVPGDYDGDGRTDAAVYRPSSANWFALRSTTGPLILGFGSSTDFPVPSAYVR